MSAAGLAVTSDAVIYLPGIMGSELVDGDGKIRWGLKPSLLFREALFQSVLNRLELRPDDDLRATRPVQFPAKLPLLSSIEPYRLLEDRLKTVVIRAEAVRPFAYDWRKSIAEAAHKLVPVVQEHFQRWRQTWKTLSKEEKRNLPEPGVTLVGHSMGGLVASYFAAFLDTESAVRRIVTLGTPFGGSLKALNVLATGNAFPMGAFASSLITSVQTFPGLYELIARWKCVGENGSLRRVTLGDVEGVGGNREIAEAAAATMDKLDTVFGDSPNQTLRVPMRCVVGTTQPTFQRVRFQNGVPEFLEEINGEDHRGDGTVFRHAASPQRIEPSYLPQSHGALAKTSEAVEFVAAALTERKLGDFQAPNGVGLRIPEMVIVNEQFSVEILDGRPGLMCSLSDAENNQLITAGQSKAQDGSVRAEFRIDKPGLYRVAVSGGGYSAVEGLVGAMAKT